MHTFHYDPNTVYTVCESSEGLANSSNGEMKWGERRLVCKSDGLEAAARKGTRALTSKVQKVLSFLPLDLHLPRSAINLSEDIIALLISPELY